MSNLNLNNNIENNFTNIQSNITNIDNILNEIYNKFLEIDETMWKAREKDKLDEEFIPYLKDIKVNTKDNLEKHLNYLKSAVSLHKSVDDINKITIDNDVSTSIIEEL